MLLAYIDEIGEPGAFVSRQDARFNTSPAFGYAGFIIPEQRARDFGSVFAEQKRTLFKNEIKKADHPGRWEKKGASIFSALAPRDHPSQLRVFDHLVRTVTQMGGNLFYYADEKPIGTPKQVQLDPARTEREAMEETLNRIARHAAHSSSNVMIIIDQINEKTRAERLPNMYGHILGRSSDYQEMQRILEPPMHVDSQLSANVQFADWIAACAGRAVDYQLIVDSRYNWIADERSLKRIRGSFTSESKLHYHRRAIEDLNHSRIFNRDRPLFPKAEGQLLGSNINPRQAEKIRAVAAAAKSRKS
ncbi:DUF3800 domain-containing protein [Brachybacterium squillarum]|uniref:DUF3800 domain-containing protein n=1 Tax=Brachybacterium squillarum TaxID=661979 RepID=UPI00026299F0|nr:DUF3800 domain-containing protein [Brachybacterium squillarum]